MVKFIHQFNDLMIPLSNGTTTQLLEGINIKPIQRFKVSDIVLKQIEKDITSGRFPPGSKLPPERELLAELEVSRNTLREALQRAEMMGLVNIRHGEGTFVNTIDQINSINSLRALYLLDRSVIREIVQARLIIEGETVKLAAENATEDNIQRLQDLLKKMESSINDPQQFREYDVEFHKEVAVASKNRVLPTFLHAIDELMRKQQKQLLQIPQVIERAYACHQKIFEKIKKKNSAEAYQAMTEHLSNILLHMEPLFEKEEKLTKTDKKEEENT